MNDTAITDLVKRAMLPASMLVLIGYFVFHAVAGNTGLVAWREYRTQHEVLKAEAATVAARRETITRRTQGLDPRKVDPDLADELVRENLGVIGPDEAVIALPPPSRQ